jgi:hypothetical protein
MPPIATRVWLSQLRHDYAEGCIANLIHIEDLTAELKILAPDVVPGQFFKTLRRGLQEQWVVDGNRLCILDRETNPID